MKKKILIFILILTVIASSITSFAGNYTDNFDGEVITYNGTYTYSNKFKNGTGTYYFVLSIDNKVGFIICANKVNDTYSYSSFYNETFYSRDGINFVTSGGGNLSVAQVANTINGYVATCSIYIADRNYTTSDATTVRDTFIQYLNGNNTIFEDITPIEESPEYNHDTAEYEPDAFENLKFRMSQWKKDHDEMETLLEFTGPLKDYIKGEGKLKGVEYVLRPHDDLLDTEHIFVPIEEYEAFLEHGGTEDKWSIKFNSNPLNNQLTYAIPYDDTIFNEPVEIESEEPIESYDIMVRPVSYNEDTRTYSYGNYTTVKNITNNTIGTETQQNYQETNEYITNLNTTEFQITNNEGDVINNYYEYTYTTINNTDNPNREPLFRFPNIQLPDVDVDPDLDIGDIFEGVDLVGLGAFLTGFLAVFLIFFNLFIGLCNWMPVWARVIFVIGVIVAFVILIVRMFIGKASE